MKWEEVKERFLLEHKPGTNDIHIARTGECLDIPEHPKIKEMRILGVPFSGSSPAWEPPRDWPKDLPPRMLPFAPDDYVIKENNNG